MRIDKGYLSRFNITVQQISEIGIRPANNALNGTIFLDELYLVPWNGKKKEEKEKRRNKERREKTRERRKKEEKDKGSKKERKIEVERLLK